MGGKCCSEKLWVIKQILGMGCPTKKTQRCPKQHRLLLLFLNGNSSLLYDTSIAEDITHFQNIKSQFGINQETSKLLVSFHNAGRHRPGC